MSYDPKIQKIYEDIRDLLSGIQKIEKDVKKLWEKTLPKVMDENEKEKELKPGFKA